jgi:prevent-host-death family protein
MGDKMDLRQVFDRMISVSELGRGQASKILQAVEDTGQPYFVLKNNKPQAVIVPIRDYDELIRAREVLQALDLPQAHWQGRPPETTGGNLSDDEIRIFLEQGKET